MQKRIDERMPIATSGYIPYKIQTKFKIAKGENYHH